MVSHAACHTEMLFLEDYMNQTPDPSHFGNPEAGVARCQRRFQGPSYFPGSRCRRIAVCIYELFPAFRLPYMFRNPVISSSTSWKTRYLYELKWMLKMQADNGGVYHQADLLCPCGLLMPEDKLLPDLSVSHHSNCGFLQPPAALASSVCSRDESILHTGP